MNLFLKGLALVLVSIASLGLIMLFRAEVYFPKVAPVEWCNQSHTPIEGQEMVERFQKALRFKTITSGPSNYDRLELKRYGDFLKKSKF